MYTRVIDENALRGDYKDSGAERIYRCCPVCGSQHYKLHVNPQEKVWYCFAGRHSDGGMIKGAATAHKVEVEWQNDDITTASMRPEIHIDTLPLGTWALEYLDARGVARSTATALRLSEGVGVYASRIIIPYYDTYGRMVYFNSRSYIGQEPKYKTAPGKHPLYVPGGKLWDHIRQVVIVEGPFDAIKLYQARVNVVAIGGKALSKSLIKDLLSLDRHYAIMLDGDAFSASLELLKHVPGHIIRIPADKDPATLTEREISDYASM